ncbi:MAG: CHASE2 domain-containing protein [Actinomycetota bacterium]
MWPKLRKRIGKWRGVTISASSVAVLVIAAGSAGLFQLLEWATLDQFFRLRPQEPPDARIVIVTIDESDINYLGHWPLSDAILAQLLEKVKAMQPRAIGLDLYRNLPTEPGHQTLVQLFKSTPNLIGVEKVAGNAVGPPPTLHELDQVGMADLVLDADGKVRRGLLSAKPNENEPTQLSLGVRLALMYLEAEGINLEMLDPNKKQLGLGKAVFTPLTGNEGGYVQADTGGYQILLNYRGSKANFHTLSLQAILKNQVSPEQVRGRIVFMGVTGQSLNDLFLTPLSGNFTPWKAEASVPERTPGVVIHANLTSQILSAALDGRPLIRSWSEPAKWSWVLLWSIIGAAETWTLLQTKLLRKRVYLRWFLQGSTILLTGSLLLAFSYVAFLQSWWIPVIPSLVAFTGSAIAIAGYYSRGLQRESNRRLAQFLEAVPVGVAVLDAKGQLYYANHAAQKLLGKGVVPDATTEKLTEVYHFYIAGTEQPYPNENLPIVRALNGEQAKADDLEIRQGGMVTPVESMGTPVYDEFGNIAYAIAAFADVTERRKAEEERANFIDELFKLNCDLELALESELKLTDAYGRFVPHQFLALLGYESIVDVQLGDAVQQEMSILFSDIRDFTSLSESMNPEDNFKFINAYLSRMEPAIIDHDGFIDKYIGDAIMALFGGGADNAVRAGIAMLQRLAEYNTTRGRPGRPKMQIGIGINTGLLMLGTVGGQNRMNGTVISDAVNLASRIEGLTKEYGVSMLISHHTLARLQDGTQYAVRFVAKVKVKGKSQNVSIFEVFDADPPEIKQGKLITKSAFEEALFLYYMGKYDQASPLLEQCLQVNPKDRVAYIYLERCQRSIVPE